MTASGHDGKGVHHRMRYLAIAFVALAFAAGCEDKRYDDEPSEPDALLCESEPDGCDLPHFPPEDGSPATAPTPTAGMTPTESERLASWDGTGDTPYGDDPDNDGRFSDVTCDNGRCVYEDGTVAAQDIRYEDGAWYWGTTLLGSCPSEESCSIAWDHSTTSPAVVR